MSHVALAGHAARLARRPSEFELSSVPPSGADAYEAEKEPFPDSALNGTAHLGTLKEKHTNGPLQRGMRVALDGLSYTVRRFSHAPSISLID